jgi:hypothetical protein
VANTDSGYVVDDCLSKAMAPLNRWTHVAATFDKGEMKIYVNGVVGASKVSEKVKHTDRNEYEHDDLHIGGNWQNHYLLDGAMDEIMIFNRALTEDEIAALYESQK